jgi:hypothetical protein
MTITFEVKWGSKRFPIEMSAQQFQKLTVGDLKLKCQELTEIQPEYMKLLAHGGNIIIQKNHLCKILMREYI